MALAYRIVGTGKLSIAVVDGVVTGDEFYEFAHRQKDDPDWHAATLSLTDARGAAVPPVSLEELSAFAQAYAAMRKPDQRHQAAIVGGPNSPLAGRYSKLRTDGHTRTIAFNDLVAACIWLAVDAELVRATIAELRDEMQDATPHIA
jgi:hypothetical protein